jgi:hypothetical protein
MKEQQFDALQERSTNNRKIRTPNVKGGKYKGNPYMNFKRPRPSHGRKSGNSYGLRSHWKNLNLSAIYFAQIGCLLQ